MSKLTIFAGLLLAVVAMASSNTDRVTLETDVSRCLLP